MSGSSFYSDSARARRRRRRLPPLTSLTSLASYTHNYPPPAPGYDDSTAGGGRSYFLQPLPFRTDSSSPPPLSLSLSSHSVARRRGPASSLSVSTDCPPGLPALPSLLTQAPDLPGSSSWTLRSPVPLLQRDDDDDACPAQPRRAAAYESDSSGDLQDWAADWRRDNPRVRPDWSVLPVAPLLPRVSADLGDRSSDDDVLQGDGDPVYDREPTVPIAGACSVTPKLSVAKRARLERAKARTREALGETKTTQLMRSAAAAVMRLVSFTF